MAVTLHLSPILSHAATLADGFRTGALLQDPQADDILAVLSGAEYMAAFEDGRDRSLACQLIAYRRALANGDFLRLTDLGPQLSEGIHRDAERFNRLLSGINRPGRRIFYHTVPPQEMAPAEALAWEMVLSERRSNRTAAFLDRIFGSFEYYLTFRIYLANRNEEAFLRGSAVFVEELRTFRKYLSASRQYGWLWFNVTIDLLLVPAGLYADILANCHAVNGIFDKDWHFDREKLTEFVTELEAEQPGDEIKARFFHTLLKSLQTSLAAMEER